MLAKASFLLDVLHWEAIFMFSLSWKLHKENNWNCQESWKHELHLHIQASSLALWKILFFKAAVSDIFFLKIHLNLSYGIPAHFTQSGQRSPRRGGPIFSCPVIARWLLLRVHAVAWRGGKNGQKSAEKWQIWLLCSHPFKSRIFGPLEARWAIKETQWRGGAQGGLLILTMVEERTVVKSGKNSGKYSPTAIDKKSHLRP